MTTKLYKNSRTILFDKKTHSFANQLLKDYIPPDVSPPKTFDGRTVWKDYLSAPKDQQVCGSCWAIVTTTVLEERMRIQSLGKLNVSLSSAKLIICMWDQRLSQILLNEGIDQELSLNYYDNREKACKGASLLEAFLYLYTVGTCSDKCIPYRTLKKDNFSSLPLCRNIAGPLKDMCADYQYDVDTGFSMGSPQRYYRASYLSVVPGTEEFNGSQEVIKKEIFKWGPVAAAIELYEDFFSHNPKEVYTHEGHDKPVTGHAVEIVGWGTLNGTPFWSVKNSWGPNWGDNGYFKILRGTNCCKIEENVVSCLPNFFYPQNYRIPTLQYNIIELSNQKAELDELKNSFGQTIEPRSGYTYNAIVRLPCLDLTPPINYMELPNWSHFQAGKIESQRPTTLDHSSNRSSIAWVISVIILVAFILLIGLTVLYQNPSGKQPDGRLPE